MYLRSSSSPTICAKELLLGCSILPKMPCLLPLKLLAVPGSISPLAKVGVRTTCSMSISPVLLRYPWWEYFLLQRALLLTGGPRLVMEHLWGCSGLDMRMEGLTNRWHFLDSGISFTFCIFLSPATQNWKPCCLLVAGTLEPRGKTLYLWLNHS